MVEIHMTLSAGASGGQTSALVVQTPVEYALSLTWSFNGSLPAAGLSLTLVLQVCNSEPNPDRFGGRLGKGFGS